jgi:hypothetical protein
MSQGASGEAARLDQPEMILGGESERRQQHTSSGKSNATSTRFRRNGIVCHPLLGMAIQKIFAHLSCADLSKSSPWFRTLFGREPDATPMEHLAEWHHGDGAGFQPYENPPDARKGTVTLIVSKRRMNACALPCSNQAKSNAPIQLECSGDWPSLLVDRRRRQRALGPIHRLLKGHRSGRRRALPPCARCGPSEPGPEALNG